MNCLIILSAFGFVDLCTKWKRRELYILGRLTNLKKSLILFRVYSESGTYLPASENNCDWEGITSNLIEALDLDLNSISLINSHFLEDSDFSSMNG
ncbi:unnamed protein product [[Candida] boidinii]|nr:unnamed protein product [[Candida] boidinii]